MKNKGMSAKGGNKKGSILAYSLIVITIMLVIVGGITVASLENKKSATSTESSVQAYQMADTGTQYALKAINDNLGKQIKDPLIFQNCSNGVVTINYGGSNSIVYTFFDSTDTALTCYDLLSKIATIKSVGTYKNTARAISASVGVSGFLYAVHKTDGKLDIFNITNPANPLLTNTFSPLTMTNPGAGGERLLAVNKNRLYVADSGDNWIETLDISDPTKPVSMGTYNNNMSNCQVTGLAVNDNYLYASCFNSQSGATPVPSVYTISLDSATGKPTSTTSNSGFVCLDPAGLVMDAASKKMYLGCWTPTGIGNGMIQVFDASNPGSINWRSPLTTANAGKNIVGLAIYDKYLYVADTDGSNNVYIFDTSGVMNNPATFPLGFRPYGLSVRGKYLYISGIDNGNVYAYNLSNPTNPSYAGIASTGSGSTPTGVVAN
ncbi:MAG TPA: hypothetical protein VF817_01130 [Patescibacteria group bacterium]